MHFRPKRVGKTNYNFKIFSQTIRCVSQYKYLGVVFDEHLTFEVAVNALAVAAGRALGALCTKFKSMKEMGFQTFTKLFNTCVTTVMDYGSEVWGGKDFSKPESVQNRAMRFYLGVHRYTCNQAVQGDMGWNSCRNRWALNMIRFWNRLIRMDSNRLTRKVFDWDYSLCRNNWSDHMKTIFLKTDFENVFYSRMFSDVNEASIKLHNIQKSDWVIQARSKPKLRTFIQYKLEFGLENYVKLNLSRGERSMLAQLRCGVLPLQVETGRFNNEKLEERVCKFCSLNETEDELHFMFRCHLYTQERNDLLSNINMLDFPSEILLIQYLMNTKCRKLAKFVQHAFAKRRQLIYQS